MYLNICLSLCKELMQAVKLTIPRQLTVQSEPDNQLKMLRSLAWWKLLSKSGSFIRFILRMFLWMSGTGSEVHIKHYYTDFIVFYLLCARLHFLWIVLRRICHKYLILLFIIIVKNLNVGLYACNFYMKNFIFLEIFFLLLWMCHFLVMLSLILWKEKRGILISH